MYWIIFQFFLLGTTFLEGVVDKKNKILITYVSLGILFFGTTGNYYNGVDWINYIKYYNDIYQYGLLDSHWYYEPGFVLLNYIFADLLSIKSFHVIIFFSGMFVTISLYNSLRVITADINKSAFILLVFSMAISLFSDTLRQCIAFSIILFCLVRVKEVSSMKWFFVCVFAAVFHSSALIMLPYKFLVTKKFSGRFLVLWFLICICIIIFLINIDLLVNVFEYVFPSYLTIKLNMYLNNLNGNIKLGFFAFVDLIMIFILIFTQKNENCTSHSDVFRNSAFIYFTLHFVFYFAPFLQRSAYYFFPLVVIYFLRILKEDYFPLKIISVGIFFLAVNLIFYRNIMNSYYDFDFYSPKFFYFDVSGIQHVNVESLYQEKCSFISKYDQNFCD